MSDGGADLAPVGTGVPKGTTPALSCGARSGLVPVPILRRACGAAALALVLPAAAQAEAWAEFETRCLSAWQSFAPPVVAGLGPGTRDGDVTRYALDGGAVLRIEAAPADGRRACAVRDPGGAAVPGFDAWIAGAVAAGRYVPVAAGRWHSRGWSEPVLEVQKTDAGGAITLRIVETGLEA